MEYHGEMLLTDALTPIEQNRIVCKQHPFKFRFHRVRQISPEESLLSGWVTHGYAALGQRVFLITCAQGTEVAIVGITINGIESAEVLGGQFPEIVVRHPADLDLANGELGEMATIEAQRVWDTYKRRTELFARAGKHRAGELNRLRKQMRCNLELLMVRGTPRQFEELVTEVFTRMGFTAKLTAATNDGGKDIICRRGSETIYVECKFFAPNRKVGRPLLQKLVGAVATDRVSKGICVTTGSYTEQAREYARRADVELWDMQQLSETLARLFPERTAPLRYTAICLECGAEVEFELHGMKRVTECHEGHRVEKTITARETLPDAITVEPST